MSLFFRFAAALLALGMAAAATGAAGAAARPAARKAAQPEVTLQGTVRSVVDGDTVWFAPDDGSEPLDVRLLDIDAPEICQNGGAEAKAWLAKQVLRRPARLVFKPNGRDRYGRLLAVLWVGDVSINRRLVEEGHAWSVRTQWDRGPFVAQERMAKSLRRGLHGSGKEPLPPWEFRRSHGSCHTDEAPRK
jgi:endonuclease YncB( thermonuclease family)